LACKAQTPLAVAGAFAWAVSDTNRQGLPFISRTLEARERAPALSGRDRWTIVRAVTGASPRSQAHREAVMTKTVMTKTWCKALATAITVVAGSLPALAQEADVPTQLVDVMNKIFGVHPGFRAQHAKGVVVEGS
jgi:hypothetical protein